MTTQDKYRRIEEQTTHAKEKWARMLGVSRSGYYDWLESREQRAKARVAYEERVKTAYVGA